MTFKNTMVMVAALFLVAASINATGFTNLHNFAYSPDGANPVSRVIASGNTVYGTTQYGGAEYGGLGYGTVFKVNTDGTGYQILHSFDPYISDGGNPVAGLTVSGNTLYGTTPQYGRGLGTVFKVNTDGTGYAILSSFTNSNTGAEPQCDLLLSSNILYGTTIGGGANNGGTVFAINTNGSGYTNLHGFTQTSFNTNADGSVPGDVIISGNTVYGATSKGGVYGSGNVFKVNTDGSGFTVLYNFTQISGSTNSDGAGPVGVALSGNTLYGFTATGGFYSYGTEFRINTDGTGFTNLYNFSTIDEINGSIVLSGNTLYGTAYYDGIFAINTDGSGFTNLYTFTTIQGSPVYPYETNTDGAYPFAGVSLSGNTLYGTSNEGGTSGYGTVFGFALGAIAVIPPQLTITASGANVILTWPTNANGFTLQSASNLVSPVWNTVSPLPVIQGGENVITNSVSGAQQFYRLQSN